MACESLLSIEHSWLILYSLPTGTSAFGMLGKLPFIILRSFMVSREMKNLSVSGLMYTKEAVSFLQVASVDPEILKHIAPNIVIGSLLAATSLCFTGIKSRFLKPHL